MRSAEDSRVMDWKRVGVRRVEKAWQTSRREGGMVVSVVVLVRWEKI